LAFNCKAPRSGARRGAASRRVRLAGRVGEADASGSAASGTGGGRPRALLGRCSECN
jgi:hypothetical protein